MNEGQYLILLNFSNVTVAVQIFLNTQEAKSHIVSNITPKNNSTRNLFTMLLNNEGSYIAFSIVASNTYMVIIVGQLKMD